MELYTPLVRLKQEMNNGTLPPMMEVPESVQHIIDPSFTIGYGALDEDSEKGLRCPVRGCGRWFHSLGRHISRSHPRIGQTGVRAALSIPSGTSLLSRKEIDRYQRAGKRLSAYRPTDFAVRGAERLSKDRTRSGRTKSRNASTTGARNLANRCRAQLAHRIIDLHNRFGRTPTCQEFATEHTPGLAKFVSVVFGSWNNAVNQCGLEVNRRSSPEQWRQRALDALAIWYERHGTLPSASEINNPHRTPLTPSKPSILRGLKTESWPEAMRRAASLLNIYGGRYGLPIENKPREDAA